MQTRRVTGGDFSSKRKLKMPLRCKLQEKITSCDSALTVVFIYSVQGDSMDSEAEEAPKKLVGIKA